MANWWDQYANIGALKPYTWEQEIGASGAGDTITNYGNQQFLDWLAAHPQQWGQNPAGFAGIYPSDSSSGLTKNADGTYTSGMFR